METAQEALSTGRDPRHQFEDAIEENGDEYVAHSEYYEGVDEFPIKAIDAGGEGQELALVPVTKYHTMAVVPGPCCRGVLDFFSFMTAFCLLIIQFGLIDYYYHVNIEHGAKYGWLAGDLIVIVVWIIIAFLSLRYNQRQMTEVCSVDAKVKYAWIAWLVYAVILVGKVATCFRVFHHELPAAMPIDNNDKLFDDSLFKLGLSLSVLIFIFLLEAFHYTPIQSSRQLYITYLTTAICLDLIDNIYFLDLLWQSLKDNWNLDYWLDIVILTIAMFNFLMPTCALFHLRYVRFPTSLPVSDKLWSLLYVLLVNVPILAVRIYLYWILEVEATGRRYDPSLFGVKNLAVIYLAIRELWTRVQNWRLMRRADGVRRELVPTQPPEEE